MEVWIIIACCSGAILLITYIVIVLYKCRNKRQNTDIENPNTGGETPRYISDEYELALLDGLCAATLKRSRRNGSQTRKLPTEWPIPKPASKGIENITENALKSVLKVGVMVMTPMSGQQGKESKNAKKKRRSMSAIEGEKIKRKLGQKLQSSKTMRNIGSLADTATKATKRGRPVKEQKAIRTRGKSMSAVEGQIIKRKRKQSKHEPVTEMVEDVVHSTTSTTRVKTNDQPDGIRYNPENTTSGSRHDDRRKPRTKTRRRASTSETLHQPRETSQFRDTFDSNASELGRSSTNAGGKKTRQTRRRSSSAEDLVMRDGARMKRWESVHDVVPEYRKRRVKRAESVPSLEVREPTLKTSESEASEGGLSPLILPLPDYGAIPKVEKHEKHSHNSIGASSQAQEISDVFPGKTFTASITKRPGFAVRESRDEPQSSGQPQDLPPIHDVFTEPDPLPQPVWNTQRSEAINEDPSELLVSTAIENTKDREVTQDAPIDSTVTSELASRDLAVGTSSQPHSLPQNNDAVIPLPPPPPPPPPPPIWHNMKKLSTSKPLQRTLENGCDITESSRSNTDQKRESRGNSPKERSFPDPPLGNSGTVERKQSMTRSRIEQRVWTTQSINQKQPVAFASGMGYRDCMPELRALLQQRQGINTP